jgi:glycine cleavage system H protein
VGKTVSPGDVLTTVESVKSVSEMYVPVAGEITAVNDALDADPALVNSDPYGDGWITKLKVASDAEFSPFMTAEQYEKHTKG